MEELFNGQLSFADIDAEKFLHVRRAHADRRVNAMDRLTARGWQPDYIHIVDQQRLLPAAPAEQALVILAAARLGRTRLIDKIEITLCLPMK